MANDFVIPSNPKDRDRIKNALKEIDNHMTIIDGAKDAIKDIKEFLKEEFEMPTSVSGRLANTFHKQDFNEIEAKHEEFVEQYEMLIEGNQQ